MTTGNIFIQTQSNGNFNMPYVSSLTCGSDIIRVMMEMLKTSTGWQPWKSFKLLYRGQAIDLNTPLVLFGEPLASFTIAGCWFLHLYAVEIEKPTQVSRTVSDIRVLARNISSCSVAYQANLSPTARERHNQPLKKPKAHITVEDLARDVSEISAMFGQTQNTLKDFATRLRDQATVGVELIKLRAQVQNTMDMLRYASNMHNLQSKLLPQPGLNDIDVS
jgi:hypothetical protein